jgi:4'-phosphopantetheinyl transferase
MEQIDSSQIHLWLAFLDAIQDPQVLAHYRALLSREELQQQQRFYFERDRHRYLVTRAMVRSVLSRYAEVEPQEWRFAVNEYGKPSIAPAHAAARGIEFNVSHTDGLVMIGVARGRAIGVDVENVRTQRAALEIADRFFAPEEVAALRALPLEEQPRRFFEYWTLKEAYIKARGRGLAIPLDRFALRFGKNSAQISVTLNENSADSSERWMFWQPQQPQDCLAAVCAQTDGVNDPLLAPVRSWH